MHVVTGPTSESLPECCLVLGDHMETCAFRSKLKQKIRRKHPQCRQGWAEFGKVVSEKALPNAGFPACGFVICNGGKVKSRFIHLRPAVESVVPAGPSREPVLMLSRGTRQARALVVQGEGGPSYHCPWGNLAGRSETTSAHSCALPFS